MRSRKDVRNQKQEALREFLDVKVDQYNRPGFIENDPITVPHAFRRKQDIEIAGFFAAVLAWGQRVTIINKCRQLMAMMDNDPYAFIRNHTERDLLPLTAFKHRTFNTTDTLYFVEALRVYYGQHKSLEDAFYVKGAETVEAGLNQFQEIFFGLADAPQRTRKHIPAPARKSTCKRLAMYLRWMVRQDDRGVDFGIWRRLSPAQLVCPCDVHVDRTARQLKLIRRTQTDWQTALELTAALRGFDAADPVKYDFALFGLGIEEGWSKSLKV